MPHLARKKSASGYYHVVPKGQSDQIIFESDADRRYYIHLLDKAKEEMHIHIYAYCLMSNHVHLIFEDPEDKMAKALKYVHERYGHYFAEKTGRIGGVFSTPFWSEPIETEEYLLCAVRYVHANPAVAGICPASIYEWSSARDYLGKRKGIADTEKVLNLMGGLDWFIQFSKPQNWTLLPFKDSRLRRHLTDDEALQIAKNIVGSKLTCLKQCSVRDRIGAIQKLSAAGFSAVLIKRLTGLGRREIESTIACATKG